MNLESSKKYRRQVEELIPLLPDKLAEKLKSLKVLSVKVAYENNVVCSGTIFSYPATKEICKEVKKLDNHGRKFINRALSRYYSTRSLERMKMLEKDIEGLEQQHYNRFAWKVARDWTKERSR